MRQFVYKWKIRDNFIHNVEIRVDNFAPSDKIPNFSSGSAPSAEGSEKIYPRSQKFSTDFHTACPQLLHKKAALPKAAFLRPKRLKNAPFCVIMA